MKNIYWKLVLFLFINLFFIGFTSSALTDNINLYYKLDGTSGAVVDATGNNDATNYGATRGVTGKIGNAFDFVRAETDYAETDGNIGITGASDRTVSLWFYADDSSNGAFFGWGVKNSNQQFQWLIHGGNYYFHGLGGGNDWDTGVSVTTGEWVHLLTTYNGTRVRLYINNSEIGSGFEKVLNTVDSKMNISQRVVDNVSYDGKIDLFGIWSRELNSTERGEIYNSHDGLDYPFSVDSCTYSSGNWVVDCSDNCVITSNVAGDGSNFSGIGTGIFRMEANITGFGRYRFGGACRATCNGNLGCIKI